MALPTSASRPIQPLDELLLKFGSGHIDTWQPLNDDVMGGRSSGEVTVAADYLRFAGEVSLENNGGFASVRSPFSAFKLGSYTHLEVRYRCGGQSFAFVLDVTSGYGRTYWKAPMPTCSGEWRTDRIQLSAFQAYRIGQRLPAGGAPSVDELNAMRRLGFITQNKAAGPYTLDIDFVRFSR